jgi:SAM-dependent methyltransferase
MPSDQHWEPAEYARHAAFVPALGAGVVDWLNPARGERILDLGCGDGALTAELVARGADVVGVDRSAEMVGAARARGLDARVMDLTALTFSDEFDAAFSNAVLHWIHAQDDVLAGVCRALRAGGRFAGEFGGHGNVAAIVVAIRAAFERHGFTAHIPWYYPTVSEYSGLLTRHGFVIDEITLFPRPTPLPTGMEGWLDTFAGGIFAALPPDRRGPVRQTAIELLRPALCDREQRWTADYVRLRFMAHRASAPSGIVGR